MEPASLARRLRAWPHWRLVVFVLGVLNTVFSLFYYVNVLRVMWIAEPSESARIAEVPLVSKSGAFVAILSACVLVTGTIFIAQVSEVAGQVSTMLLTGIAP